MSSITSPIFQKYRHFASKGGGKGVKALLPYLKPFTISKLSALACSANYGVAPT